MLKIVISNCEIRRTYRTYVKIDYQKCLYTKVDFAHNTMRYSGKFIFNEYKTIIKILFLVGTTVLLYISCNKCNMRVPYVFTRKN